MIVVFVSSHDQVLFGSFEANTSNWFSSITRDIHVCHVIVLVASLSLIIWVHRWKHATMYLLWVVHIHLAWVSLPLPLVNWGLSFHSSMVIVWEGGLTWILSKLMNLCIIVIITLLVLLPLLKVFFGGVVTQNLLLFLLILVLYCRRPVLRSILFVISFTILFLLHCSCRSASFYRLYWSGVLGRWFIFVGLLFKLIFSIFISIIQRLHGSLLSFCTFNTWLF